MFKDFLVEEVIPRKNGIPKVVKNFYHDESIVELLDNHYVDQHKFITDNNGNIIVDFIGRFENLNDDFTLNDVLSYIDNNKSVIDINYFRENDWKVNQRL